MATPNAPKNGREGRNRDPANAPAPSQNKDQNLTPLAVFHDHLGRAGQSTGTLIRYLLIISWLAGSGWLLLTPYFKYVHKTVSMLLNSPDAPRPISIVIAVAVLGMPVLLFRPRISVRLVRALAALLRVDSARSALGSQRNNDGTAA